MRLYLLFFFFVFSCDKNVNGLAEEDESNLTYFNITLSDTGESTLFIFRDTISSLSNGDEIGLFDLNGILNSNGDIGEILVGSGVWTNNQLEIIAITGSDLSDFNGPILPGAIRGNDVKIKIWDKSNSQLRSNISTSIDVGTGSFNGLFTAYLDLTIQE